VLTNQIENKTFERYLLNQTNWENTLPDVAKKNAALAIKDHYTFEFLNLSNELGYAEYLRKNTLVHESRNLIRPAQVIQQPEPTVYIRGDLRITFSKKNQFQKYIRQFVIYPAD